MARKISKRDTMVWNCLLKDQGWLGITDIAKKTELPESLVILALKNLIAHVVVRKELHLYRAY